MADFDLFVIGAGSGGVRAARVASAYGARVGIAEEHKVGGTCVIRGCVPKKLLVYGAHFAEDLNDAAMFGWDIRHCEFILFDCRRNRPPHAPRKERRQRLEVQSGGETAKKKGRASPPGRSIQERMPRRAPFLLHCTIYFASAK